MRVTAVVNCSGSLKMNLLIIKLVCFFGFFIIPIIGCSNSTSKTESATHIDQTPIEVKTYAVKADKAREVVTLSGLTEPVRRATPAARIMAKVVEAIFQEGERVEAGHVLIRLDTRDLLARKSQAQAASDTAATALNIAKLNLDRMRNLKASGSVSRHQMELTEVAYAQAEASVAATKSAIEELEVNFSYSVAAAPFQGTVVRKMVEEGNMVAPGQPLFIIEDDSKLRVIAPLGTDLSAGLTPGMSLPIRMGDEMVTGVIEGIVSSGSTGAPGLRIQLIVDNSQRRFRTGTLAVVEIPIHGSETESVFVPREALIQKGWLTGAYVVTNDFTARLHWLILDKKPGDLVNVLSGLHEGDRVILSPEKTVVTDGRRVKEVD